MRITKEDAESAFIAYSRALEGLNISKAGHHLEYRPGSKVNGISFKLVWVDGANGGHCGAFGTDGGGYIGWTRKEAVEMMWTIARTLHDVAFFQQNQES